MTRKGRRCRNSLFERLEDRSLLTATLGEIHAALDLDNVSVSMSYSGNANAVQARSYATTAGLLGLPSGPDRDFLMISSGTASDVDTLSNTSGSQGTDLPPAGVTGDTATIEFTLPVAPSSQPQRLKFDFMFLSEEYPEYVGTIFNDFFTATIDGTNVALDQNGNIIDVNNAFFDGDLLTTGTFFDGRTALLTASYLVQPGDTSLEVVLSVGDRGDGIYDSAVLIDNFRFETSQVIYLNFEGESGLNFAFKTFNMPAFEVTDLLYAAGTSRENVIDTVVGAIRADYAGLDIHFVTSQPTSGDYMHVIIGGNDDPLNSLPGILFGQAASLDFGNLDRSDTAVVFSREFGTYHANHFDIRYKTSDPNQVALYLATTISHEVGHNLGLRHLENIYLDAIMKKNSPRSNLSVFHDVAQQLAQAEGWTATFNTREYLESVLGATGQTSSLASSMDELLDAAYDWHTFDLAGTTLYDVIVGVWEGLNDGPPDVAPQAFRFDQISGATQIRLPVHSAIDKFFLIGSSTPGGPVDVTTGALDADGNVSIESALTTWTPPGAGQQTGFPLSKVENGALQAFASASLVGSAFSDVDWLPNGRGTFVDDDGDTYTVELQGPGNVAVVLNDLDANGKGSVQQIVLHGTTAASSLHIYVQRAGDGLVNVGGVAGALLQPIVHPVANVAPVVNAGNDQSRAEGQVVTLAASFVDPGAAGPHTATINWGDGTTSVGAVSPAAGTVSGSHAYADDGTYVATVKVTDEDGATGSDILKVIVTNVVPTASITGKPATNPEGTTITLGSSVTDPGSADTHTQIWSISTSNGQVISNGSGGSFSFVPNDNGTYTVLLTVTDDDNASTSDTAVVTVNNVAPSVNPLMLSSAVIDEDGTVTVDGTFTDPGTLDSHTVEIDWGDGNTSAASVDPLTRSFTASHQYLDDGASPGNGTALDTYTISVSVADDDNASTSDTAVVTVNNVAPAVSAVAVTPVINEGGTVNLSFNAIDPGMLDTFSLRIDWGDGTSSTFGPASLGPPAGGFSFGTIHRYLDDNPTGTPSDVYTIGITVTDDDGGGGTANTAVTVNNVAPSVNPLMLSSAVIDEDGTVTVDGTFTDPGTLDSHTVEIDWGDGNTSAASVDPLTRSFTASHQFLDDNPTNSTSDTYAIGVTLTDDDTGIGTASVSATVNNVDPVLTSLVSSSPACGGTSEGNQVSVSGRFTDVGTLDSHVVTVNWGDGTPIAVASISESGGSGSFTAPHTYSNGGVFLVTVTVTDDDTGSATDTVLMVIAGAGVNGGVLYVIGTNQADHVTINKQGNDQFRVHADFFTNANFKTFATAGVDLINVILCDGDDHATIAGNINTTAIIDGGAGNDYLNGGGGSNIVLGGAGADHLNGGSARDLLIGGYGSDGLVGNGGQDILIGDATVYDSDYLSDPFGKNAALLKILAEWNAPNRSLATRRANITGTGAGPRLNDNFFFKLGTGSTLIADLAADVLTGSSAEDWFLLFGDDEATDLKVNQGDLFGF